MKNCCKTSKKDKKCVRSDGKEFSLPRRFSKKKCLNGPINGFTMRSSCAPYNMCPSMKDKKKYKISKKKMSSGKKNTKKKRTNNNYERTKKNKKNKISLNKIQSGGGAIGKMPISKEDLKNCYSYEDLVKNVREKIINGNHLFNIKGNPRFNKKISLRKLICKSKKGKETLKKKKFEINGFFKSLIPGKKQTSKSGKINLLEQLKQKFEDDGKNLNEYNVFTISYRDKFGF